MKGDSQTDTQKQTKRHRARGTATDKQERKSAVEVNKRQTDSPRGEPAGRTSEQCPPKSFTAEGTSSNSQGKRGAKRTRV